MPAYVRNVPNNPPKKIRKHESVNWVKLKQTAKANLQDETQKQLTNGAIKKAELDFALDLPLLVEEMTRDMKILNVSAKETDNTKGMFYPYQPHRNHLTTRFGLLFYNDKDIKLESMRSTIVAMLHQGDVAVTKMDEAAEEL